ncbi:MAG: ribosome silencing factor [Phycisphaerales bacterium]|nr:ribosome silencing factor [Phycisphaerales bacterium]
MAKQVKKVAKKTASAAKPSRGAPAKASKAKAVTPKKVTPKVQAKKAPTPKATKPKVAKLKAAKVKAGPSKVSKPKGVKTAVAKPAAVPVEAAIVETAPAVAAKPVTQDVNLAFAIDAARLAHDDKCTDVVLMDVRGLSQVTDYIIVGSGSSERQMRSVLDHIQDLGATRGFNVFRTNKDERALWLLADFVHVVVHLFEPATRSHYDLEMLWGDAPRVEWERPDQMNRDRAGLKA